MTESGLKHRTITATAWQMSSNILCYAIQFVITIILARYIMPAQYGIIAITLIFLSLAQAIINSNLGTALIRKSDRTQTDCSTVFYYNITLSVILYAIMYPVAPAIAAFYGIDELTQVLQVMSLILIIGSFGEVQKSLFTAELKFKTLSMVNIISTIISGITGITMAVTGFKVWALVAQSLTYTGCNVVLMWVMAKWHPSRSFSFKSLKEFFSFGSKIMVSNILNTITRQIYTAVIGKLFAPVTVGLYNRAETLANLTSQTPTETLTTVSYPVLCRIKDDDLRLRHNYRRIIRLSAFVIFPLCLGVASVAYPLTLTLLTENWMGMAPILQILAFSIMWYPIHALNLNLLQVKGRSDLHLRVEIIKKMIILCTLAATAPFGLIPLCLGRVATSLISLVINTYYTGKLLSLTLAAQIKDLMPTLLLSVTMFAVGYTTTSLLGNNTVSLLCGIAAGATVYAGGAILFRFPEISELRSAINALQYK